jgi:hypothetical protein
MRRDIALSQEYQHAQLELAGAEISRDYYPPTADMAAIHQAFEMHRALPFETRDRETRDEKYDRWGVK